METFTDASLLKKTPSCIFTMVLCHLYFLGPHFRCYSGLCFCSPNHNWLRQMRKNPFTYMEFYLPYWTYDELRACNIALDRQIAGGDTVEAMATFWRHCSIYFGPRRHEEFGTREFDDALAGKINSLDDVLGFFDRSDESKPVRVSHCLLHFDMERLDGLPELRPGTDYIAFRIKETLDAKLKGEREKPMNWLDGQGKPATFLGWLFENYAHEEILDGITLQLRNLSMNKLREKPFLRRKGTTRDSLLKSLCRKLSLKRIAHHVHKSTFD